MPGTRELSREGESLRRVGMNGISVKWALAAADRGPGAYDAVSAVITRVARAGHAWRPYSMRRRPTDA